MRLRALTTIHLRKNPKVPDDEYTWRKGEEFDPPEHMNVSKALARGIVERVGSGGGAKKKKAVTDG